MLYIVSTPIGNMKDITLRAIEVLKEADLIAAEDTRHTRKLTQHYQIKTPLTSYFEHNELQKGDYLIGLLKKGKKIALVTDAGTPGISDPGYRLIQLAQKESIPVTVVPGPCALIAALSLSGLPNHQFVFEGFLPVRAVARRKRLAFFKEETRTVIFYVSVHRIIKVLQDIDAVMDNPQVVLIREITKKFEEVLRGSCQEILTGLQNKKPKGEFVLLVSCSGKR